MSTIPMLGDWEIPRIQRMFTDERRQLVELPIPGRAGGLLQDLNSAPAIIEIEGSIFAEQRSEFLTSIREKFRAGEPLTFVADITEATDIQYVMIEQLQARESSRYPDQIDYRIRLRESPPPPPPPDLLGGIDTGLLDAAAGFIDGVTDVLDAIDALANIPDFSDPGALLGGALDEVSGAVGDLDSIGSALDGLFGSD